MAVGDTVEFSVSAYCPDARCTGRYADGITKAGTRAVESWTVAADPRVLPIGSLIHVEGVGERMVQDIGGAIQNLRLDLYMESHAKALVWGRQQRRVTVLHIPDRPRR